MNLTQVAAVMEMNVAVEAHTPNAQVANANLPLKFVLTTHIHGKFLDVKLSQANVNLNFA
jgi:hypothetical protein